MARRKNRSAGRKLRQMEHERDVRELGDIRSSSGHGGLKMAGLDAPIPNRFRRKGEPPARPLSIREMADELYRQDHGGG